KISMTFTIAAPAIIGSGTDVSVPDASPSVRLAMKSAQIAPIAAPSHEPRIRSMTNQSSAYATTSSAAPTMVGAHSIDETPAQAKTMMAAAITPAAWSSYEYTASEVAVSASVRTASAPKSGHGGVDQIGSIAVVKRKKWPSSPR